MKKVIKNLICYMLVTFFCLTINPTLHIFAEENGSTKKTAQIIETGKEYEKVTVNNQTSWFQYKVKETGYIKLNLIPTKKVDYSNYCSWNITVTLDNKKLIDDVNTSSEFTSAELGLKKGTVVYIQITGNHSEVVDKPTPYLLSINNKKSSYWESEINNTKKQANIIKANKKYYGNSYYGYPSSDAEKDFFKFKVTKNGKLVVYFGGKELGDNRCWYRLNVYVNSKEKASSYSLDNFKKIKTIDVKKGDVVYLVATTTESYSNYALKVKYK